MKRGFTLLELLIVITILAILAGAMIPLFRTTRYEAQVAKTTADLDAIKTAVTMMNYDTQRWGSPSSTGEGTCIVNSTGGCALTGWGGPYMTDWAVDSWGNNYFIRDATATTDSTRWAVSLGADQAVHNCWLTTQRCSNTQNTGCDFCTIITSRDGTWN